MSGNRTAGRAGQCTLAPTALSALLCGGLHSLQNWVGSPVGTWPLTGLKFHKLLLSLQRNESPSPALERQPQDCPSGSVRSVNSGQEAGIAV